jgi:hypothetical protein
LERGPLATTKIHLKLYVRGAEKQRAAFERYMVKLGAHSLAAVQSIHALADIVAHSIYFATGQNLGSNRLDERKVALQSVAHVLKKDKAFAHLSAPLAALTSGNGWKHIAAVSNVGKHRSVVRAALSQDLTGTRIKFRELQVSAVKYGKTDYPAKSFDTLINPEFHRLMVAIVALGIDLNASLRRRAGKP